MQQLLPVALRGLLPDNVTSVLFDLCAYFREVSAKVLHVRDLEKLEQRIKITLCRMEMIFPPGFFYCYGAFGSSASNKGKNRWPCGLPFNVVFGKVSCQK